MSCERSITPASLGLTLYTSDISLYDGANLSCVSVPAGATLNQILVAFDQAICAAGSGGSGPISSASVSYGGGTTFDCFTITGTNVEDVIEELATQICSVSGDLGDLTLNDLTLGATFDGACVGTYNSSSNPVDLLQDIVNELCNVSTTLDTVYTDFTPKQTISDLMGGNDIVVSGAGQANLGLFATISSAVYIVDGARYAKGITANIPLTATADNYLDYDSGTDGYVVSAVAVSDPAPAIAGGRIRIWKMTTNGLSVTATSDLRVSGYMNATLLMRDSVTATQIATGAVTGVKMETLGAGASVGSTDFFQVVYDTKGRVTSVTSNIDLTGLSSGDVLQYDGSDWVAAAINTIGGSGTAGQLAVFTGASAIGDSLFYDDGTTQGINAVVAANIQVNIATTLDYGMYLESSGTNADQIGYYSTVSGGTSTNIGAYFKAVAEMSGLIVPGAEIAVVATAGTLNAREAYGMNIGVVGDPASSGDCIGLYINVDNDGSGKEYGIVVENGQVIFGGTAPDDSALLQLDSTTQGLRLPRMTTVQRDAIASPASGLMIYNSTTNKINVYTTAWEAVTSV